MKNPTLQRFRKLQRRLKADRRFGRWERRQKDEIRQFCEKAERWCAAFDPVQEALRRKRHFERLDRICWNDHLRSK